MALEAWSSAIMKRMLGRGEGGMVNGGEEVGGRRILIVIFASGLSVFVCS